MPQTQTIKIPKLRFPGFSSEWEEKALGDVLKIGSGKDYKHLSIGEIPVFGTGGLMTKVNDYLYDGETVCIGRKGTIDKPMYHEGKIRTVDTLFYTHSFKKSLPKFIYYIFLRINRKEHNEGSGVPSLSKSTIETIKVTSPILPEQIKIASFLTHVGKKIDNLTSLKSERESYKKGVIQQIFSQQIRFKDDDGEDFPEWEDKALGSLILYKIDNRGKTPPISESGIPLIEVNAIGKKEINYDVISKFVSEETYNNRFRQHLKKGDVLFSTVGATALCSYYTGKSKACVAQNIVGLRFEEGAGEFMFYLLTYLPNNNRFKEIEMGAVQPSIKVSQMVHLVFSIPSLPEQQKIANFLSQLDERIGELDKQIEQAKQRKKGLLQGLFI